MAELSITPPNEEKQIRCPRLGGPVHFGYCRIEHDGWPCSRALTCWAMHFEAEAYFRTLLSEEQFAQCFLAAPQSKMDTLLEAVERARLLIGEKRKGNSPPARG
ncbi:MAG: hypothetical protein AB1733_20650 [Thermodesulfobacteriota bacterium]